MSDAADFASDPRWAPDAGGTVPLGFIQEFQQRYKGADAGAAESIWKQVWADELNQLEEGTYVPGSTWSSAAAAAQVEFQIILSELYGYYQAGELGVTSGATTDFINAWAEILRTEKAAREGLEYSETPWPSAAELMADPRFVEAAQLYPFASALMRDLPVGQLFSALDPDGVERLYRYDPIYGLTEGGATTSWTNIRPVLEAEGIDPAVLDEYEARNDAAMANIEVIEQAREETASIFGDATDQRSIQQGLVSNLIQNRRENDNRIGGPGGPGRPSSIGTQQPWPTSGTANRTSEANRQILARVIPNLDPEAQMSITGGSAVFTNISGRAVAGGPEMIPGVTNTGLNISDIINNAVNSRGRSGRSGGGGTARSIAFDEDAIREAMKSQWYGWLLEEADDGTVDKWVKGYMAKARDLLLRGGPTLNLEVYTGNELRKTPKYKNLYKFKPQDMGETDFLRQFLEPINQIGLRADNTRTETRKSAASGGSASGQIQRIARTQEGMAATNFSARFGQFAASLGGF